MHPFDPQYETLPPETPARAPVPLDGDKALRRLDACARLAFAPSGATYDDRCQVLDMMAVVAMDEAERRAPPLATTFDKLVVAHRLITEAVRRAGGRADATHIDGALVRAAAPRARAVA